MKQIYQHRWISILTAIFATALALFIFHLFIQAEIKGRIDEQKNESRKLASDIAVHIEQSISEKSSLSKGLASYVRYNPQISQKAFNDFAKEVYEMANREILAVQLVKDSIITYNYPDSGNLMTVGVNILTIFKDRAIVKKSMEERMPILIGPRKLLQGKQGMVYREPIIINSDSLWGFSAIVMDLERIIDQSPTLGDTSIQYGLYSQNNSMLEQGYFYGNTKSMEGEIVEEKISLPTDTWRLVLSIDHQLQLLNNYQKRLFILFTIISIIIGILLGITIQYFLSLVRLNKLLRQKNSLINTQLQEKIILIKEIHHRIKNHFQLISSLNKVLYHKSTDSEVHHVIEEVNTRIESLAQAYDQIAHSSSSQKNDMKKYIPTLVHSLLQGVQPKVEYIGEVDEISLFIKRTVYVGVIINELIMNSLKYAFKGVPEPKVLIRFKEDKGNYCLVYMDNGKGIPENAFVKFKESTGMQLLQMFSSQLEGEVKQINKDGNSGFEIIFPTLS